MYGPIPSLFTYVENPLMTRISSAHHIMIAAGTTRFGSAQTLSIRDCCSSAGSVLPAVGSPRELLQTQM